MKICIVLNGKIKDYHKIKDEILNNKYDFIICADGGANHTYKMDIVPDYILGDLDSISNETIEFYKKLNVKFKEFPSKKNETDTQLCIYLAQQLKASEIHFIGALGGRLDHMIANIDLLYYVRSNSISTKIISDTEDVYIAINEKIEILGNKNDEISIMPIKGDAIGVTYENLEYPLNNYYMDYAIPRGISNVMLGSSCSIDVKVGSLIIIKNK